MRKIIINMMGNASLAFVMFLPTHLVAQDDSTDNVLEEVIVTAQRREQNINDVGISITAFSGDRIRDLGLTTTEDLDAQVPSLIISSWGGSPAVSVFTIRGVSQNDYADHNEAPNAVYIDGAYISTLGSLGAQMFDLERVEILRGPQGTLFGRNATGGVIHLVSRKPTDIFEGYVDATFAEYNQVKIEAAVGGSITEGVKGRLSFASNHHDGYVENRIGKDRTGSASFNARGQLLFDTGEDVDFLLSVRANLEDEPPVGSYVPIPSTLDENWLSIPLPPGGNNSDLCSYLFGFSLELPNDTNCVGFAEPDDNPWTGAYDNPGYFKREIYGVTGTLTWDLENFQFTSITDYQDVWRVIVEDTDGTPMPLLDARIEQDTYQFSQEFRLSGETDRVHWQTGLYYLKINGDYSNGLNIPLYDADSLSTFSLQTESYAIFAQADYALTPELSVIGGLRWTEDDKKFELFHRCEGYGCPYFTYPGAVNSNLSYGMTEITGAYAGDKSDGEYAAKFQLDWKPNDDLLLFAGVTRGNKAGGFNAPQIPGLLPSQMPYDPEVLTNYEAGFKATIFNNTTQLNGSVFYYDYNDYQAFNLDILTQVIFNTDATVKGGELEIYSVPAEGWELSLGLSLLDATVEGISLPNGTIADQDMPQAPDVSFNGLVRKSWPVWNGSLALQVDFNYVGSRSFNTINHPIVHDDSYFVGNARVSYTSGNEKWQTTLFVNNIAEEEYVVIAFDGTLVAGGSIQNYGPPRWFGGTISYRW